MVVGPDTRPERVVAILFLQDDKSIPALAIGEFVKFIFTVSITALQLLLLVEVKINFTKPFVSSLELGA